MLGIAPDSPNFTQFRRAIHSIVTQPENKFERKFRRIRADLTASPDSLKDRCRRKFHANEESLHRDEQLIEAYNLCIKEIKKYPTFFIDDAEITNFVKFLTRMETLSSARGWSVDKVNKLAREVFKALPLDDENKFIRFRDALFATRGESPKNCVTEIKYLLEEAINQKDISPETRLDILRRIYLLNPQTPYLDSLKEDFVSFFSETFYAIYIQALPKDKWKDVLGKWIDKKYFLLEHGLKKINDHFQGILKKEAKEINKEFEKLNQFYNNLGKKIRTNEMLFFIRLKKEALIKLFPLLGRLNKESTSIRNVISAFGFEVTLEEMIPHAKVFPEDLFQNASDKKITLSRSWQNTLILLSDNASLALCMLFELSLKTYQEVDVFKEYVQNFDFKLFADFLNYLILKSNDRQTTLLAIERLLACHDTKINEKRRAQLIKLFNEFHFRLDFIESIQLISKVQLLLEKAKEKESEPFIETSLQILASFFPYYLKLYPERDQTSKMITWTQKEGIHSPYLRPLNLDDKELEKVLVCLNSQELSGILNTNECSLDLDHFPNITFLGVQKLLENIPKAYLLNCFNQKFLNDIEITYSKKTLYLNSGVLCLSPYFKAMLSGDFKERKEPNERLTIKVSQQQFSFFERWGSFFYDQKQYAPYFYFIPELIQDLFNASFFQFDEIAMEIDRILYEKLCYSPPREIREHLDTAFKNREDLILAEYVDEPFALFTDEIKTMLVQGKFNCLSQQVGKPATELKDEFERVLASANEKAIEQLCNKYTSQHKPFLDEILKMVISVPESLIKDYIKNALKEHRYSKLRDIIHQPNESLQSEIENKLEFSKEKSLNELSWNLSHKRKEVQDKEFCLKNGCTSDELILIKKYVKMALVKGISCALEKLKNEKNASLKKHIEKLLDQNKYQVMAQLCGIHEHEIYKSTLINAYEEMKNKIDLLKEFKVHRLFMKGFELPRLEKG